MTSTNLPDASSIDLSSRLHSRTSVDPGRESEVNASNLPVWGGGKGRLCHRTGGTLRADNRHCGTRTEVVARGINPVLTIYAHPRSDPRPRQEAVRLPGTRKSCGDWGPARVANVLGVDFSGLIAWMMWRALNLSLIPGGGSESCASCSTGGLISSSPRISWK